MADITHLIGISARAPEVFKALSTIEGLAAWWTSTTTGESKVGKDILFSFHSKEGELRGAIKVSVVTLEKDKLVKWRVIDGPPEWLGTEIPYELNDTGKETLVKFSHRGWKEIVDFTYHCSMKWATYLLSLRDLVQSGKGKPNPHDLKIEFDD